MKIMDVVNSILKLPAKTLVIIGLGLALVGAMGIVGFMRFVTSNERYCLHCHGKQRYIELWKESKVHPKVSCADCHGEPGKYINFSFSADDERTTANCLRCHREFYEPEKIERITFKFNRLKIKIPHNIHLEMGIMCTVCHNNIRHERSVYGTYRPHMDTCFQCHRKEDTFCLSCHPKGTLKLPLSRHASQAMCIKCHNRFDGEELAIFGVKFLHQPHIDGEVDCDMCHSNAQRHGRIIITKEGCKNCHEWGRLRRVKGS
jgi:hypothetical protein